MNDLHVKLLYQVNVNSAYLIKQVQYTGNVKDIVMKGWCE